MDIYLKFVYDGSAYPWAWVHLEPNTCVKGLLILGIDKGEGRIEVGGQLEGLDPGQGQIMLDLESPLGWATA